MVGVRAGPSPPAPRKAKRYPIPGAPDGGTLLLFGDPGASRIALVVAGYPDDHENFLPLADRLAAEAPCLVGVACLPGYEFCDDFPYSGYRPGGYTFDEMASALREAAGALLGESTHRDAGGRGASLTGIFHDFGCMPGPMLVNRCAREGDDAPLRFDRTVILDVLPPPNPAWGLSAERGRSPRAQFIEVAYRIIFAVSFLVRRHLSKLVARAVFVLGMIALTLSRQGPTLPIDAKVFESRRRPVVLDRMIYMAYPYVELLRYSWGMEKEKFSDYCLPEDLSKIPVLYMYGAEKRIHFHEGRAVRALREEARRGGRSDAVEVEGAGHYLFLQQPDLCVERIVKFMKDD